MNDHSNVLKDLEKAVSGDSAGKSGYTHPNEAEIIAQIRKNLAQIEVGKHLLRVADQENLRLRIVKSGKEQGFVPAKRTIYIGVPLNNSLQKFHIILECVSALRQAEQELLGFEAPGVDKPLEEHLKVNHAKRFDQLIYECAAAVELDEAFGTKDATKAVQDRGHGDILEAFMQERV